MARELTEKQKVFLEVLFSDEVMGDFAKAKVAAGYSPQYATSELVKSLKDEILEATREYMIRIGPKAATVINNILDNPTQLGVRDRLAAARDALDRAGVIKTEKVEVTSSGIFILPPKRSDEDG